MKDFKLPYGFDLLYDLKTGGDLAKFLLLHIYEGVPKDLIKLMRQHNIFLTPQNKIDWLKVKKHNPNHLIRLAKKDPAFRKRLIAGLGFSLGERNSREVEQRMSAIYSELRELKAKLRPLGPHVMNSLKQMEEDWKNLDAMLEKHLEGNSKFAYKKIAGSSHRAKMRFSVKINRYEEDFTSGGVQDQLEGQVYFPDFDWLLRFDMIYSPKNSSWPIEELTIIPQKGSFLKVKEDTFWWKFFTYLHEENMLSR